MSPQAISADIHIKGAKATVDWLNSSQRAGAWSAVIRQIENGDPRWVMVAGELASGTDAGTSEDLQISLATALPKNPIAVLQLAEIQSFLSLKDLCGAPFIEPSQIFLKKYLKQAKRALRNLHDARVEARRSACLVEIVEIEKALFDELKRTK